MWIEDGGTNLYLLLKSAYYFYLDTVQILLSYFID